MTPLKNEVLNKKSFIISVYGVGFIGQGNYKTSVNRKKTKEYSKWNNILHRCYDKNYKENNPTYKDVTVCEEWHNFQVFAQWFEDSYIEGFQLDKDILSKSTKIYSPETCCFVPIEINSLFKKFNSGVNSLPRGISYDKINNKYKVSVSKSGKTITKGRYSTVEEAVNIYKIEKETEIKRVANKYKYQITQQVYQALINYKITYNDDRGNA